MKKYIALNWTRFTALSLFALLTLALALSDYMQFRRLAEHGADAWYSSSWVSAPVTNFMLSGRESREFWKVNAIGNERWLIREVSYEGTTFWTTLRRDLLPAT